jgi:hypothetical protein
MFYQRIKVNLLLIRSLWPLPPHRVLQCAASSSPCWYHNCNLTGPLLCAQALYCSHPATWYQRVLDTLWPLDSDNFVCDHAMFWTEQFVESVRLQFAFLTVKMNACAHFASAVTGYVKWNCGKWHGGLFSVEGNERTLLSLAPRVTSFSGCLGFKVCPALGLLCSLN